MIGGYQIIDLRGIDLEVSESASNITNAQVLKQLLELRGFIDKAYNFSKPLETQLKPVLIRFRDKKNGEKIEGTTYGELSIVSNYYTFKITGRISGQYTLEINVAFKEITNAYGNKDWVIDTATIQLIDASNVLEGDIAIDGDLSVSGDIEVAETSEVKVFENIVDKDGHKRFIEGNCTFAETEGITGTFGKWSLSGSHLTIVLAGTLANGLELTSGTTLGLTVGLPSWVLNKIYPVFNEVIEHKLVECWDSGYNSQNLGCYLNKETDGLRVFVDALTLATEKGFRIAFDLLIDNE